MGNLQQELLKSALFYASLGYEIFPVTPGQKNPLGSLVPHGVKDATTDEDTIRGWWKAHPEANIGLSTNGLCVIDIDGDENEWLTDVNIEESLSSASACARTPRGGLHYIFKQTSDRDFRNTTSKLAKNVDTRADGGYILVSPSVLVDPSSGSIQGSYSFADGFHLNDGPDWIEVVPRWITDRLNTAVQERKETGSHIPADGIIKNGTRNQTLFGLGSRLRRMGCELDSIHKFLIEENRRCETPMDLDEVRVIAERCMNYDPDQNERAEIEGWNAHYLGEEVEEEKVEKLDEESAAASPFPQHLLNVPGFIKEVMDYNLSTAYRKQPELALSGAIALMGTLAGRKVKDVYKTRTNIYCLSVARSGSGKENARKVNKEILDKSGLASLIGPEGLASHAGLMSAMITSPCCLSQLDEIGRLIKTMSDPKASSHLYNIATVMMKLYTSSDGTFKSDNYSDSDRVKTVVQPNLCILGTTVPSNLYDGLTFESLTDGFLSRMFIFEATDHNPVPSSGMSKELPQSIIDQAVEWGTFNPGGGGLVQDATPRQATVPYSSSAETIFQDLEDMAHERRQDKNEGIACMWTRVVEKARKLALIYACSKSFSNPVVDGEAASWAVELAVYLTNHLIYISGEHVAENHFDGMRKKILTIIKGGGKKGLSKTQLCRLAPGLRKRDRDEIIESLVSSKQIIIEPVKGLRMQNRYFAIKG